jgi:hypothetical protein
MGGIEDPDDDIDQQDLEKIKEASKCKDEEDEADMILNSMHTPDKDQILAVSKMDERTDLDLSHFENNHHFDDTHNK